MSEESSSTEYTHVTGVCLMPLWGVVGAMAAAEFGRASGRYTLRTAEEAPRSGGCRLCVCPGNDGGRPVVTHGPGAVRVPVRPAVADFSLFC